LTCGQGAHQRDRRSAKDQARATPDRPSLRSEEGRHDGVASRTGLEQVAELVQHDGYPTRASQSQELHERILPALEREPSDAEMRAQRLTEPCEVDGRLTPGGLPVEASPLLH